MIISTIKVSSNLYLNQVVVESYEKIFGDKITISLKIYTAKVPRSVKSKNDETFCDFKKHPATATIIHNGVSKTIELTTLAQKKVLLGDINVARKNNAREEMRAIKFADAVKLFHSFDIIFDTSKISAYQTTGSNFVKRATICTFNNSYYFCGKVFKKLSEVDILNALADVTKCYVINDQSCSYIKIKPNYYVRIRTKLFENNKERSVGRIITQIRTKLCYWDGKLNIDTSGSLKNKNEFIDYLNVGKGYIPISSAYTKKLSLGKAPNVFTYRDARDKLDKLAQLINSGTTGKLFIKPDNENAVIVGFTEEFVNTLINKYIIPIYI